MSSFIRWVLSRKVFILRSIVFALAVIASFFGRSFASGVFRFPIAGPVRVFHLLWAFVMFEMVLVLIPKLEHFNGCGKIYKKNYIPLEHKKNDLKKYTEKNNRGAVLSAGVWALALFILYFFRNNTYILIMAAIFFYFLDQFFVNVWCAFKSWIIKNRCCATCRIYNWGFPIIVSPLIYIRSFWSWSLVFVSIVILIQWERLHYKHPERFSEISNKTLLCRNCNDKCKNIASANTYKNF